VSTGFGLFAVGNSVGQALTYALPEGFSAPFGSLFQLPVRGQTKIGLYLGPAEAPSFSCLPIGEVLPYAPSLPPLLVDLALWVGRYYLAPPGRAVSIAAPGFLWKFEKSQQRTARFEKHLQKKGAIFTSRAIRGEVPESENNPEKSREIKLSDDQKSALEVVLEGPHSVTLLEGVTGSGKTEVYLSAVKKTLESGRNALVLVPEIALTPQMSARFRSHFGEHLALLHSGLTPVEHEREWFRVLHQDARVVLGVRSAVFAPLSNVGIVIVDEEHDGSYKCDDFPCYQARDVAVKRAQLEKARCVLGSATPSLETVFNVKKSRYNHAELKSRFSGTRLSSEVIDARLYALPSQTRKGRATASSLIPWNGKSLSPPILEALKETKARQEQSMVIINRRGYSNYALCRACGESLRCPNCSVTTTLHTFGRQEICHYCGFSRKTLSQCPHCSCEELIGMGTGTQNVEAEIQTELPHLRVDRLDRDVLTSNTRLTSVLHSFRTGEVDCLVGTQMLSKGHDFPKVSLVVLLHLEDTLLLPDFRSAERTFQLLVQSAGRAGRAGLPGKVLLQSLTPQTRIVEQAMSLASAEFFQEQLALRELGGHPPFNRQILLEVKGTSERQTLDWAMELASRLKDHWKKSGILPDEVRLAGPVPATVEKIKEAYRFHLCLTTRKGLLPHRLIPESLAEEKVWKKGLRIDVDPLSFL
jgi:primosomal protein N' (replication factor Y) (superfamily II helicase)